MKIRITKELKTYDKPVVGGVYEVIKTYTTEFGTHLRYIEVNGNPVGIKINECEVVEDENNE